MDGAIQFVAMLPFLQGSEVNFM